MTSARMSTLASLRGRIERIETPAGADAPNRIGLGHAEADEMLQGGLATAAIHEVFSEVVDVVAVVGEAFFVVIELKVFCEDRFHGG